MPEVHRLSKPEIVFKIFPREPSHHSPHFHIEYQGKKMSVSIDALEEMDGYLPANAKRRAFKWAEENQDFLRCAWDAIMSGKKPPKFEEKAEEKSHR
ncbi:MAG: DUF4160 domain-containing protein [Caldilineaceae bacterium]|nr:DUF4160 domain-containing protein [Caldilineaceae bacterium]